jgi:hypothetical protein
VKKGKGIIIGSALDTNPSHVSHRFAVRLAVRFKPLLWGLPVSHRIDMANAARAGTILPAQHDIVHTLVDERAAKEKMPDTSANESSAAQPTCATPIFTRRFVSARGYTLKPSLLAAEEVESACGLCHQTAWSARIIHRPHQERFRRPVA